MFSSGKNCGLVLSFSVLRERHHCAHKQSRVHLTLCVVVRRQHGRRSRGCVHRHLRLDKRHIHILSVCHHLRLDSSGLGQTLIRAAHRVVNFLLEDAPRAHAAKAAAISSACATLLARSALVLLLLQRSEMLQALLMGVHLLLLLQRRVHSIRRVHDVWHRCAVLTREAVMGAHLRRVRSVIHVVLPGVTMSVCTRHTRQIQAALAHVRAPAALIASRCRRCRGRHLRIRSSGSGERNAAGSAPRRMRRRVAGMGSSHRTRALLLLLRGGSGVSVLLLGVSNDAAAGMSLRVGGGVRMMIRI